MARHIIKALPIPHYSWLIGLIDITDNNRVLGEDNVPYHFPNKNTAYNYCAASYPANSTWQGRKEHAGYSIEVD